MVQVVVGRSIADDVRSMLDHATDCARAGESIELLRVDAAGSGDDLAGADAAVRWDLDDAGLKAVLDQASDLRWLHSPGAGVERWPLDSLAERRIVLTNGAGVFAIPIAEWVLTTMLTVVKNTYAVHEAQKARDWARALPADELYDKTVLVLGAGGIGREIIKRADAFGMRIWASNRSGRAVEGAVRVAGADAWRDLLPDCDFVVSTLPMTPATSKLIGAPELARLKPSAWLLNVGRGATIDEDALAQALVDGAIGGAALDVWTTEPLQRDSPLWSLPNMIVSPHMSGSSPASRKRGLQLFVDNLRRFAAGEELANVVDLASGY
jgi:phosphoglycerate dehydrogenase-like enzyme